MSKNKLVKRLSQFALAMAFMVTPVLSTTSTAKLYAHTTLDESSYDTIGDVWTGSAFNKNNLVAMLKKVTGYTGNNDAELYQAVVSQSVQEIYPGIGVYGKQASSMNNGRGIEISFGDGLNWTVTFLTQDNTTSHNTVLTLWLSDSYQLGEEKTSSWSSGWYANDATLPYPSNMYGTSYIRSKLVGSEYVVAKKNNVLQTGDTYGDEDVSYQLVPGTALSQFANYKNSTFANNYIVEPARVTYQQNLSYKALATLMGESGAYDYPNDAWGSMPNSNFYDEDGDYYNYTGKTGYDWSNDKLWLPAKWKLVGQTAGTLQAKACGA